MSDSLQLHGLYSLPGSSVHGISRQEYWSGLPFPSSSANPDMRILLLILMLVTLPKDIWGGFRHKVEFREWISLENMSVWYNMVTQPYESRNASL